MEGKVTLMNKTYAADSVTTNNALTKLKKDSEELQAHDITTQNTLVQLQWALETGHREATDNHALLKSRVDLLQQIQQHVPGHEGAEAPGKSIEIKFTTLGAEDDGEEDAYESTTYANPAGRQSGTAPAMLTSSHTSLQQNVSTQSAASVRSARTDEEVPAPPAASRPAARGGYSAFLTESVMSSPDKSSNKSSFLAQAASSAVEENRSISSSRSLDVSTASVERSNTSAARAPAPVSNTSNVEFVPARDYSLEERKAIPAAARSRLDEDADEFDLLSQSEQGSQHSRPHSSAHSDEHSVVLGAESPASPAHSTEEEEAQQEHSLDVSEQGPSHASPQRSHLGSYSANVSGAADISSLQIPMISAIDMSMPSYVSHIDSSGDANQSSFDYSYPGRLGSAAPSGSDDGSRGQPARKLSVGSDDSLQNLNSTVEGLVRHRDTFLDSSAGAANATVAVPFEEDAASHSDADVSSDESTERSFSSSEDESDVSEAEDAAASSGPARSFSQIDGPAPSESTPALRRDTSAVENSWDNTSLLQSSFVSASSGSSPSAPPAVNASTSSASAAAPAKVKAAFKIPTLNMSSVPVNTDEREPPSDRFSSRGAAMTSGRQSMVSDWDGDSSFASETQSPLKPITPRITPRVSAPVQRATPPVNIPSLQSSMVESPVATNASPNRSRNVIGASQSSPAGRPPFDDSTGGGSVSDTSSGSSYTASSSSYLTISSASPTKPSVAASATATRSAVPVPVPTPAPMSVPAPAPTMPVAPSTAAAAPVTDLNASKTLTIK